MNRPRSVRSVLLGSLVLGALCAAPRDAEASGYLTARFGSDHGAPAHPNAFAIYFNPAALGGTKGTTVTGDLSVLLRTAKYTRSGDARSPSDPSLLEDQAYTTSNTGAATLTNLLALPFAGVNTDLGTSWLRLGYAVYVPFGGFATWDRKDADVPGQPGSIDGPQRWHNISGQILAIYNTLAAAAVLGEGFSVGASFSPVFHTVSTARARNANGSDDTVGASGELQEGRSLIHASGLNFAASAGVYYERPNLRLGLSYLSQPGFGTTRMSGELTTQLGSGSQSKSNIDFLQTYPDIIRFGAAFKLDPKLELRGDFEFVRWSVFDRQCVVERGAECAVASDGRRESTPEGQKVQLNVPRNWNNAVGIRVGPGYWINEQTELFGSLALTTSAVPKETIDASTIDSTRLYGTVGARFELSKAFSLAASYNHIYFFPVDTKGANDQNLSAHPSNGADGTDYNVSRSPSADGKYTSQIGFVNINAAYTF